MNINDRGYFAGLSVTIEDTDHSGSYPRALVRYAATARTEWVALDAVTPNLVTRAVPAESGCWIDGHWGQYGTARLVSIAHDHGWHEDDAADIAARHLAAMCPSNAAPVTDEEYGALADSGGYAEDAEDWLNAHVAPEGYTFGWHDGEFFLSRDDCREDAGANCGTCWSCAAGV